MNSTDADDDDVPDGARYCPDCGEYVKAVALPYRYVESDGEDIEGWMLVCPLCPFAFAEVDDEIGDAWTR